MFIPLELIIIGFDPPPNKNSAGHLSLRGVVLHQRVVREGVAGNHCAAGACHGIQRLFLGENMAGTGWEAVLNWTQIGQMRIKNG